MDAKCHSSLSLQILVPTHWLSWNKGVDGLAQPGGVPGGCQWDSVVRLPASGWKRVWGPALKSLKGDPELCGSRKMLGLQRPLDPVGKGQHWKLSASVLPLCRGENDLKCEDFLNPEIWTMSSLSWGWVGIWMAASLTRTAATLSTFSGRQPPKEGSDRESSSRWEKQPYIQPLIQQQSSGREIETTRMKLFKETDPILNETK